MIIYNNILEKLNNAGYSSYRMRKEKIFSESTISSIRNGDPINTTTLDKICKLTGEPIENLIEYRP